MPHHRIIEYDENGGIELSVWAAIPIIIMLLLVVARLEAVL